MAFTTRHSKSQPTKETAPEMVGASIVSLDDVLLALGSDNDRVRDWTLRDAVEGTQVFGGTGSGKTTGSGRAIAMKLLGRGFGGLVLSAKPGDAEEWAGTNSGYVWRAGRRDPPVIIGPPSRHEQYRRWGAHAGGGLNFLAYEYERVAKTGISPTFNLTTLLVSALEGGQDRSSVSTEPYWDDALRQLVRNGLDLVAMAEGTVNLSTLYRAVITAPTSRAEARSTRWQARSLCWELLEAAEHGFRAKRQPAHFAWHDFVQTALYWLEDFAGLSSRTRGSILSMFTSRIEGLLRSPLRQLFVDARPDALCTPEATHDGRVVILDYPVKTFGELGRTVQVLFKTVWQLSTEDRPVRVDQQSGAVSNGAPVFLWADEAQYFVTSHDLHFQQTARSRCAATVYLTQSLSNYRAAMPGRDAAASVDALLGNLQTKVFHANSDPVTNQWAERLIGTATRLRESRQTIGGYSASEQEQELPLVPARTFTTLRSGGLIHNGQVDAILFKPGKQWGRLSDLNASDSGGTAPGHDALNFLRWTFQQDVR